MIDMPPGWVPNNDASVDPHLECDLKEIKEHPPTQEELMPSIVEKLKECYDPEISVDIYNLGLIYDVKVTRGQDGARADEPNKCILSSGGHHTKRCYGQSGEHIRSQMQGQNHHATTVGSRDDQP